MGGLDSAAAVAALVTTAARLVADAYMAAPADVAAASATAASAAVGPVSCMDFISRDIYATFAVELVWTLPYQFV